MHYPEINIGQDIFIDQPIKMHIRPISRTNWPAGHIPIEFSSPLVNTRVQNYAQTWL